MLGRLYGVASEFSGRWKLPAPLTVAIFSSPALWALGAGVVLWCSPWDDSITPHFDWLWFQTKLFCIRRGQSGSLTKTQNCNLLMLVSISVTLQKEQKWITISIEEQHRSRNKWNVKARTMGRRCISESRSWHTRMRTWIWITSTHTATAGYSSMSPELKGQRQEIQELTGWKPRSVSEFRVSWEILFQKTV